MIYVVDVVITSLVFFFAGCALYFERVFCLNFRWKGMWAQLRCSWLVFTGWHCWVVAWRGTRRKDHWMRPFRWRSCCHVYSWVFL